MLSHQIFIYFRALWKNTDTKPYYVALSKSMLASHWDNVCENDMPKWRMLTKKGSLSLLQSPRLNPSFFFLFPDPWNEDTTGIYEFLKIKSILHSQMKPWNSWSHTFACEVATWKVGICVFLHAVIKNAISTHGFL